VTSNSPAASWVGLRVARGDQRRVRRDPAQQALGRARLDLLQRDKHVERLRVEADVAFPFGFRKVGKRRRRPQTVLAQFVRVPRDHRRDVVDDRPPAVVFGLAVDSARLGRPVRARCVELREAAQLRGIAGDDVDAEPSAALLGEEPRRDLGRREPQRLESDVRKDRLPPRGDGR